MIKEPQDNINSYLKEAISQVGRPSISLIVPMDGYVKLAKCWWNVKGEEEEEGREKEKEKKRGGRKAKGKRKGIPQYFVISLFSINMQ